MNSGADDERSIFEAALALTNEVDRNKYLDEACKNAEHRRRFEALLAAAKFDTNFMRRQAGDSLDAQELDQETIGNSSFVSSEIIGRYKLLQKIGEGGFGVVYMAEQEKPVRRQVALKIIKPGMDTKQVIGRFEAERQALAMLDHPNIAKVLDAGSTEQGRPYFVMELVRGEQITDFCDANRLDTTQRLELFIDVGNAIQHAHQKGIIHRDIKPSNVLVTLHDDRPVPKVIDFGIAKATEQRLTERTVFTEFKQFIGTPAYMSPEQASLSGLDIDTRSDVYSLGVLLYELIAGVPPFDEKELRAQGFEELCRVIRETVPPTPSSRVNTRGQKSGVVARNRNSDVNSLRSKLRGEVDWIVMKSLEKDGARRYETANALTADIRRYLAQEPVLAGPPSTLYQFRKFVQRHRSATLSALAIITSLLIGIVVATAGLLHAVASAQRENQRANQLTASEARMRRNLYVTEMGTAKREYDQRSIARTRQLLEKYLAQDGQPDLRGFEWRWLWNQCHRERFQLAGGPIYDTKTAGAPFRDMRFSPDGKWLASGAVDGFVRLWDIEARKQAWSFKGGTHCNAVDFSRDGKLLLTYFQGSIAGPNKTFIWDLAKPDSPKVTARIQQGVRFLPDGNGVVADDGAEFDLLGNQTRDRYIDRQSWSRPRHYSRDWKTLAANDSIWDVDSGTLVKRLPDNEGFIDPGPNGAAISPTDSLIATGGPKGIRIWDRHGNPIDEVAGSAGTPFGWLSFSANGRRLAARQYTGAVMVFETATWTEVDAFPVPNPDSSVVFSPVDNDLLVAGGCDGVIRGYSVSPADVPDVTFDHSAEIKALRFSPDGRLLAVGGSDGSILFWDVNSRKARHVTDAKKHASFARELVAFSPDSRFAAIIGPAETISVWDVNRWEVVASWTFPEFEIADRKKRREYWAVCFSKNGRHLFGSNFVNEQIDVWDWPPQSVLFAPTARITSQAQSLDTSQGGLLAGAGMETRVWSISELAPVFDRKPQAMAMFFDSYAAAFSPRGTELAISNEAVDILSMPHGELIGSLPHSAPIDHISWSPDGSRVVASDQHATTKIWDIETRQAVATFRGTVATFSPDGTVLAVGGQGSKYIGDIKRVNRVTLYYAPPLYVIDRQINAARH